MTATPSAQQFAWLKAAIANQRTVWDILLQTQRQTVACMGRNLPSTGRRKQLSRRILARISRQGVEVHPLPMAAGSRTDARGLLEMRAMGKTAPATGPAGSADPGIGAVVYGARRA